MHEVAPQLQVVSFVRPTSVSSQADSSIQYTFGRDEGGETIRVAEFDASFGQIHPLPPHRTHDAVRGLQWLRAASKQNPLTSVFVATAGGVLLGEAGRMLYSHHIAVYN